MYRICSKFIKNSSFWPYLLSCKCVTIAKICQEMTVRGGSNRNSNRNRLFRLQNKINLLTLQPKQPIFRLPKYILQPKSRQLYVKISEQILRDRITKCITKFCLFFYFAEFKWQKQLLYHLFYLNWEYMQRIIWAIDIKMKTEIIERKMKNCFLIWLHIQADIFPFASFPSLLIETSVQSEKGLWNDQTVDLSCNITSMILVL